MNHYHLGVNHCKNQQKQLIPFSDINILPLHYFTSNIYLWPIIIPALSINLFQSFKFKYWHNGLTFLPTGIVFNMIQWIVVLSFAILSLLYNDFVVISKSNTSCPNYTIWIIFLKSAFYFSGFENSVSFLWIYLFILCLKFSAYLS